VSSIQDMSTKFQMNQPEVKVECAENFQ